MFFELASPVPGTAPRSVGTHCARHTGASASALCTRCGDYLCERCVVTSAGQPVLCATCADAVGVAPYYVVPVWRFVVLSVCTLGVYHVYWGYRSWRAIKARDGSSIWPLPRALFLTFTYMGLIEDVNTQRAQRDLRFVPTVYGGAYFLTNIASRVLDSIMGDAPMGIIFSLALVAAATAFLVPTLTAMRELTSEHELAERDKLRGRHIFVMIVMGLGVAITIFYAFMPRLYVPER